MNFIDFRNRKRNPCDDYYGHYIFILVHLDDASQKHILSFRRLASRCKGNNAQRKIYFLLLLRLLLTRRRRRGSSRRNIDSWSIFTIKERKNNKESERKYRKRERKCTAYKRRQMICISFLFFFNSRLHRSFVSLNHNISFLDIITFINPVRIQHG